MEPEGFVECIKCKRLQHERCMLYLRASGLPFICDCCRKKDPNLKTIKFSSQMIPKTDVDTFIEKFLWAHKLSNSIVVRMVSNVPKVVKLKSAILKYRTDNFADGIKYNNCLLLAFFKLPEGSEICIFAVYFQLYGNEFCPIANRNSVYLSYIDSVKCNIPERTKIYQHILMGLFKFLKMKNFQKIFIWSCPPKKNVDYIFFNKPPDMKIPTKGRLKIWYQELINLTLEKRIIESFSGIDKYALDENWKDLTNIPYFDNDLWPDKLEMCIQTAEKRINRFPKLNSMNLINHYMKIQIDGFSKEYFVLTLNSNESCEAKIPISIYTNWINVRENIVNMCFENKLEFTDERLGKYTTLVMIYRILFDMKFCIECKSFADEINVSLNCTKCLERPVSVTRAVLRDKNSIHNKVTNVDIFNPVVMLTPQVRSENCSRIKPNQQIRKRPLQTENTVEQSKPRKIKKSLTASHILYKRQYTPMVTRSKIRGTK